MLFKHAQMGIMPKAKPLPEDPVEREKVLRRKRQMVDGVNRWRKANPTKARILWRTWKAAERIRAKGRAAARLADAGI